MEPESLRKITVFVEDKAKGTVRVFEMDNVKDLDVKLDPVIDAGQEVSFFNGNMTMREPDILRHVEFSFEGEAPSYSWYASREVYEANKDR